MENYFPHLSIFLTNEKQACTCSQTRTESMRIIRNLQLFFNLTVHKSGLQTEKNVQLVLLILLFMGMILDIDAILFIYFL